MATQKQRRKRAKEKRHAYDLVEIDAEGNETLAQRPRPEGRSPLEAEREDGDTRGSRGGGSAHGTPQPPTWGRVLKRGAILAPIFLATVMIHSRGLLALAGAIVQTIFLLAIYDVSYVMDYLIWRSHEKRLRRTKRAGTGKRLRPARYRARARSTWASAEAAYAGVSPSR